MKGLSDSDSHSTLPAGIRSRLPAVVACIWCGLLAFSAVQSAEMFVRGLGTAPAYGDTTEYWRSAEVLRVDEVRTWTYPLLLRLAPGAIASQQTIAFMQLLQMAASIAAASYLGWVLARLLQLRSPFRQALVVSSAILSGGSFIAVHMAHSMLLDSLASSGWLVLMGALMLLLCMRPVRPLTWLAAAVPAATMVAGLRWERTYLAIPLIVLTGVLIMRMRPRLTPREHRLRLTMCAVLAATTLGAFFITKYTLKVEGSRDLAGTGDAVSHALATPSRLVKTFVESLMAPVSTVAATSPGPDITAVNGAVGWTNTRVLEHLGYWPTYLWLTSAVLVAVALIISMLLGLPGLLGVGSPGRAWVLAIIGLIGLAALNSMIYKQFHPRYCVPITGFELAVAATVPLVLLRRWVARSQAAERLSGQATNDGPSEGTPVRAAAMG